MINVNHTANTPGYTNPYAQPSPEEQLGRPNVSAPAETQQAVPPANETQARQPQQDEPERRADGDERVGGQVNTYA